MKTLTAALIGSTMLAGAAMAQSGSPGTSAQPAGTPQGAGTTMSQNVEMRDGFIVQQKEDQILGSNLMDADIRGANGEEIGEVEDVLLDREGRVIGVAVEVGGFLGMGEKEVAIPVDQLEFVTRDSNTAANAAGGNAASTSPTEGRASTAASNAAGADAAAGNTAARNNPAAMNTPAAGTNNADGTNASANANNAWNWSSSTLDHIKVNFTREQLEKAPEFQTANDD
ncbi:hypothetical protein GCM10007276_33720 [Agaricicola taiwanensis]|uniref:PRC-barrel domain-containing protein n=1 Tax=Agaricicola taiwanensis TaxID=591372 RepID=A0A8J2YLW2_9RHOB|nr:PRC-barrel domain-containing protein [Agaricicola taiwanensis]GGE53894.1 hypothetical protein GCM10007276_33720 [Agaricicola taiwanensis]